MGYSLRVMDIFTTDLLPEIIAMEKGYQRQVDLAITELLANIQAEAIIKNTRDEKEVGFVGMETLERLIRVKISRQIESELDYIYIFHRLEYLSIYINQKLVIDDVVYTGLNDPLLKFMHTHCQLFYEIQTEAKGFKSLQKLYEDWTTRKKVEDI